MRRVRLWTVAAVITGSLAASVWAAQEAPVQDVAAQDLSAQDASGAARCKKIQGDLVEQLTTTGCKPEHPSCFLGEVDANHGLRGTTYFRGDAGSSITYPTAPTFRGYTGNFEYTTAQGMLVMKEVGSNEPSANNPAASGMVNAFQRIVSGTGEFEGATGYLFVSGFNQSGHVVTTLHGVICKAPL